MRVGVKHAVVTAESHVLFSPLLSDKTSAYL